MSTTTNNESSKNQSSSGKSDCSKCPLFPACLGEPEQARHLGITAISVCGFCNQVFRVRKRERLGPKKLFCKDLLDFADQEMWQAKCRVEHIDIATGQTVQINVTKVCNNAVCVHRAVRLQEKINAMAKRDPNSSAYRGALSVTTSNGDSANYISYNVSVSTSTTGE